MAGSWRRRKWVIPFGLTVTLMMMLSSGTGALTERVAADWRTGLALYGFDPVTYFASSGPKPGRPELEYAHAGVTWRFRNEGNRAAFAERPDIYMPQYGGYDPIAIAQGAATPGHPELWLIRGGRLYMFHSSEAREAFLKAGDSAVALAEKHWPQVVNRLIP